MGVRNEARNINSDTPEKVVAAPDLNSTQKISDCLRLFIGLVVNQFPRAASSSVAAKSFAISNPANNEG